MTFALALVLLGAIAVASSVSGRLLVGALRLRWLLPFEPTRAAASTILGTAACVVAFDRASSAGLSAPRTLWCLALAHAGLLAAVVLRSQLRALRPVGRPAGWAGLLATAALAGGLALVPVLRASGYQALNDTYTYCAFSEWLQDHGFGTRAGYDPTSPVAAIPVQWQQWGFPLGASYALALVEAGTGLPALAIYPVVSAWGLVLAAGGIWVAARWVLRVRPAWAAAAAAAYAALPHPGYWAHHNGFLSQTYAVPALLLAIASAARVERTRCSCLSPAVVLALLAACLLAVYVPFVPLAGVAALVGAAAGLRRQRGGPARARWLSLHAWTAALFLLAAGLDLRPLRQGLPLLATVNVGYPIPLSFSGYLSFAVGTMLFAPRLSVPAPAWLLQLAATTAAVLLAGVGLARLARRPRTASLLAVIAVLGALVVYEAVLARDPWSGRAGHTWNLFKAVQWASPALFLLQLAGAERLARWPAGRAALLGAGVLLLARSGAHWTWGEQLGLRMRAVIQEERPLRELPVIRQRFASLPPGTLLLLGRPGRSSPWLGPYTALLAYPRRIALDWSGSASNPMAGDATEAAYAAVLGRVGEPDVVVLRAGVPAAIDAAGAEILGGGMSRLVDVQRPRLVQASHARGAAAGRATASLQLGSDPSSGRLDLVYFSAREVEADLRIAARSDAGPLSLSVKLTPGVLSGRSFKAALDKAQSSTMSGPSPLVARVRLRFTAGYSTLVVSSRGGCAAELDDVAVVPAR